MAKDRELMHSPIDAIWDWSYLIGLTAVHDQFERTGDVAAS